MSLTEIECDIFSEKLDTVHQKTDFSSNLKHDSKKVFSIFNSFISLNFSKKVFEAIHFIKFVNLRNMFIWDLSVYSNSEIIKKIFQSLHLGNNFNLILGHYSYSIPRHRISLYLIIIDFIEEFIGIDNLIEIQNSLKTINDEKNLKNLINSINRKIYKEITDKLPNAHSKKIAESLYENTIRLLKLKYYKFNNKEITEKNILDSISFKEIDDDFIIELWKIYCDDNSIIQIKSFKKIFNETIKFIKSLFINSTNIKNVLNTLENKKTGSQKSLKDVKEKEYFINDIFEKYVCSNIENEVKFCSQLNEKKINLLKKNELSLLNNIQTFDSHLAHLKLSFYRNLVFSGVQNQIIEADRRGKKKEIFKSFNKLSSENLYKIQYDEIKNIRDNANLIIKLLFLKLWEKSEYFCLNFINEVLSSNELLKYEEILNKIKTNLYDINSNKHSNDYIQEIMDPKEKEIYKNILEQLSENKQNDQKKTYFRKIHTIDFPGIFCIIKIKLIDEKFDNFINFNLFLKTSKSLKSSYRRQGLRNNDPEIPSDFIIEIGNNIVILRNFLDKFLNNYKKNEIFDNFHKDFEIFTRAFKSIYKMGQL